MKKDRLIPFLMIMFVCAIIVITVPKVKDKVIVDVADETVIYNEIVNK